MKRREMLLTTGACALGLSGFPFGYAAGDEQKRHRVLMFTKSAGFQHSVIRRDGEKQAHAEAVFSLLARQHGIDIVPTKDGSIFDSDLSGFDAFLFYTTGDLTKPGTDKQPPMSADGKKRLLDIVASGKGFVGSHCASDTFHTPSDQKQPDPYIAMLGGEFLSHGAQQKARQINVSPEFPGAGELGDSFELLEEWYAFRNQADDLHVVLLQDTEGMKGDLYQRPDYPATWARKHGDGRVFYTSMGHREDVWTNPIFQDVLLGGLSWAIGTAEADVTPNVKDVVPKEEAKSS